MANLSSHFSSTQIHLSAASFDTPQLRIMKCSEELVYVRVSRVVDGPQCICAWLYLCAKAPFLTWAVRFLLSDTSRERRDSINTATPLNTLYGQCPGFGFISLRFYDAKLFIGPHQLMKLECPVRKWRGKFLLRV